MFFVSFWPFKYTHIHTCIINMHVGKISPYLSLTCKVRFGSLNFAAVSSHSAYLLPVHLYCVDTHLEWEIEVFVDVVDLVRQHSSPVKVLVLCYHHR